MRDLSFLATDQKDPSWLGWVGKTEQKREEQEARIVGFGIDKEKHYSRLASSACVSFSPKNYCKQVFPLDQPSRGSAAPHETRGSLVINIISWSRRWKWLLCYEDTDRRGIR